MGRVMELAASSWQSENSSTGLIGLVLGSGTGNLAEKISIERRFDFADLGIILPRQKGHAHEFLIGELDGVPIVISSGRPHLFQNKEMIRQWMACFIRFMGAGRDIILTSAVGSLLPQLEPGMVNRISDAITLFHDSSSYLHGEHVTIGDGFGDNAKLIDAYRRWKIEPDIVQSCLQCMVTGPSFETTADSLVQRALGAHVAGMSGVPELMTLAVENNDRAENDRFRAIWLGVVSNYVTGVSTESHDHDSVLAQVAASTDVARLPELIRLIGA